MELTNYWFRLLITAVCSSRFVYCDDIFRLSMRNLSPFVVEQEREDRSLMANLQTEDIRPTSNIQLKNIVGDTLNGSSENKAVNNKAVLRLPRSSDRGNCFVEVQPDETKEIKTFPNPKVTLYLRAHKLFQRLKVKLHIGGLLRPGQSIKEEEFTAEEMGITDDGTKWHRIFVGTYFETGSFFTNKWAILVSNNDIPSVLKSTCYKRPTDKIVAIELIAIGQSEWSCDVPLDFVEPKPDTWSKKEVFSHGYDLSGIILTVIGVILLLLLLLILCFMIRYLSGNSKCKSEDNMDIPLRHKEWKTDRSSISSRPLSHISENSLYGVIIN